MQKLFENKANNIFMEMKRSKVYIYIYINFAIMENTKNRDSHIICNMYIYVYFPSEYS